MAANIRPSKVSMMVLFWSLKYRIIFYLTFSSEELFAVKIYLC